jgi:hypothetical protein
MLLPFVSPACAFLARAYHIAILVDSSSHRNSCR